MFLNIVLNLITAYLICSIFENLFIFFIVLFSIIILNCEILSLFCAFKPLNIIIVSALFFIAVLFWFIKSGKKIKRIKLYNPLKEIKKSKMLLIFSFCFLIMILSFFIVALFSPPLEPDSRMYHFVRIFYYIKQASFAHFDTNQARNIIMPFNCEMIYTYFYIFKKTDTSFGLLSWFSFLFLCCGIFNILKELEFDTKKSLFCVLTFSSFGIILVQVPSLQTDIVVSSFIIASIYLFIKGINKDKKSLLFFSTLSYSLAIGSKTTALIAFPSFLLIIFAYLKIYKKNIKILYFYFLTLILNFFIFASYNYILNYIDFHNLISNEMLKIEHSKDFTIKRIIHDTVFLVSDFLGFKGGFLRIAIENFQNSILNYFDIQKITDVQESVFDERRVGFSFQGIFVFLPCLILSFVLPFFKKQKQTKMLAVFSMTFLVNFLIIIFQFPYSPFLIRYFVLFFALSCFCLVLGYELKIYRNLVITFLSINMLLYAFFSSRCPLRFFLDTDLSDFKTVKEFIMIKKQKDIAVYFQYKFLKKFKNEFKKEDKIAVLNDDNFYEIIQLINSGYNIYILKSKDFLNNDLSYFDYIFLMNDKNNYRQRNDNYTKDEIHPLIKNFYCQYLNNGNFSYAQLCVFNKDFMKNKNFYLKDSFSIEHIKVDIYQKR